MKKKLDGPFHFHAEFTFCKFIKTQIQKKIMYVNEMVYHSSQFMDEFSLIINGQAPSQHEVMKLFKALFCITPHVSTIIWLETMKNNNLNYQKKSSVGNPFSQTLFNI